MRGTKNVSGQVINEPVQSKSASALSRDGVYLNEEGNIILANNFLIINALNTEL